MSELPIQQGGLRVLSGIVPASSASTYGTHYSYLGVGGYVEVPNIDYRNSIPPDSNMNDEGYSTGRRRYGMMVYVIDEDKLYRLFPFSGGSVVSMETFTGTSELNQVTMLSNNNGWIEVPDLSVLITGGTYFSGNSSIVLYDSTGGTVSITGITTTDIINPGDGRVLVSTGNSENIFVAQSNMVFNGTNLNITGGTFITDSSGSLHSSAIIQFKSTTKGVLLPGMTTSQKNAIVNPTTGLTVYDSTIEDISVYTSSGWTGVIAERDNLQKVTERGNSTNSGLIISGTTYLVGSGSTTGNTFVTSNSANTQTFTIKDNGNILIGTTTDSGNKLDVNGNVRIQAGLTISNVGTYALSVSNGTTSGIGSQYFNAGGILYWGVNNVSGDFLVSTNGISYASFFTTSTRALQFGTNQTARMTIFPTTGNIGINTITDAGYKLDVNGSTRIVGSGSTTGNTFVTSNSANTQTFTIKDNGNVLIGTTTDAGYKLDVVGADSMFNGVRVGLGAGGVSTNTVVGSDALNANTAGSSITAIGYQALKFTTGSNNTAIGKDAGLNNTTGSDNTYVGYLTGLGSATSIRNTYLGSYAGYTNSSGNDNVALGFNSLFANISGSNNTAVGQSALASNTASNNTAVGYQAGYSNTSGTGLTAIGYQALRLSTGDNNTAVGFAALDANTTGIVNTALGANALGANTTGGANTAIGVSALQNNTTGLQNTANGVSALQDNTTGSSNTANGISALQKNTTGNDNTANGVFSLYSNTTGSNNTANGLQSLFSNTTGASNTANGVNALQNNTTGSNNTANGASASQKNTTGNDNTANGKNALENNTTGSSNTSIGVNSLANVTTSSNNTAVGFEAGYAGVANTTGANNIFIGYQSTGVLATESNRTWIGNSSTTSTWLAGNVLVGTTTDAGYKLNVNGTVKISSTIYLGGNTDIIDPSSNSGFMTIGSNQPIRFTNASSTEFLRIATSGNVLIGRTTDFGYRLDVSGTTRVVSTGSTSGSTTLTLQNSTGRTTTEFRSDGVIGISSASTFTTQVTSVISASTTNSGIAIVPNGTGAFTLSIPDGTATGGDARGQYTIDLQLSRTVSTQVASGDKSIVIGNSNTATNTQSIAIGTLNNVGNAASGFSIAIGNQCSATPQYSITIGNQCSSGDNGGISIGNSNYAAGYSTAIGSNVSAGGYYAVALGKSNSASSDYSTVSGGQSNVASTGTHATVIGGLSNTASGQYSIVGGQSNTSSTSNSSILGGWLNINSGGSYGSIAGGRSNVLSTSSWYTFIGGGWNNGIINGDYSVIVGGFSNSATTQYAAVIGGSTNRSTGLYSLTHGLGNIASSTGSTAIGFYNTASGAYSVVLGSGNTSNSNHTSILGGVNNNIYAQSATIVGGSSNLTGSYLSFIGGGNGNYIANNNNTNYGYSSIVGGNSNKIGDDDFPYVGSFIGGGIQNKINATRSFLGSGYLNRILTSSSSFIGGGESNTVNTNYSVIVGGTSNTISTNAYATIVGGLSNTASGAYSIAGGHTSIASGDWSTAFGDSNATGTGSFAAGTSATASGNRSISIGQSTTASGSNSIALGLYAAAASTGSFSVGEETSSESVYGIAFGYQSHTRLRAQQALSSGNFGSEGSAQQSLLTSRAVSATTSGSTITLSLDGTGVTNLITPYGNNRAWNVVVNTITVCTVVSGGTLTVGDAHAGEYKFLFKRVGGTSTISPITTSSEVADTSMATASFSFSAGTSQQMAITFNSPNTANNSTFRAVAKVALTEVAW